jgi:hypothetical protein
MVNEHFNSLIVQTSEKREDENKMKQLNKVKINQRRKCVNRNNYIKIISEI